jgi:predicted phosphodiesterase
VRVAALYDIHGNLPALEAVLEDIRSVGVDAIVVGGDVLPGPMPSETLACLTSLDWPVRFISGNGERIVLAQAAGREISEVPEQHRDVIRWTAAQLRPGDTTWLAGWPATCEVEIDGLGRVLFCHATPRNDSEVFTRLTPEDRLLPVFADVDVPFVVCGHTHMQFERTVRHVRVINAGSVGMPFTQPPGAYWLLLGPDIELRCSDYDFARAADRMRATAFPLVEDFAVRYVLNPPTEAEMLALFSPVELR